jgi:hypothetical protein
MSDLTLVINTAWVSLFFGIVRRLDFILFSTTGFAVYEI